MVLHTSHPCLGGAFSADRDLERGSVNRHGFIAHSSCAHLCFRWDLELAGWHVARFINGALTLGVFLFVERVLGRLGTPASYHERTVIGLMTGVSFVQTVLGIYTLACSLVLLATTVDWPVIHIRWFPL